MEALHLHLSARMESSYLGSVPMVIWGGYLPEPVIMYCSYYAPRYATDAHDPFSILSEMLYPQRLCVELSPRRFGDTNVDGASEHE